MTAILDRLGEDHGNMSRLYDLIDRELNVFKTGEHPDYDLVKKIVDYCLDYPDTCHHPMEDIVFQKLKARHPAAAGVVGRLDDEHRKLAALTRRFSAALGNVLEDEQLPREWFLGVAADFLSFSRRHMQMEEVLFFPAARRHLTRHDWAEVEAAAEKVAGWASKGGAAAAFEADYRDIVAWADAAKERDEAASA